jgi:hypothetical protein
MLRMVSVVWLRRTIDALARVDGDDPGLELLAPLAQRLDALGHGIAHGDRGIDRQEHCGGGEHQQDRAGVDDIDAEQGGRRVCSMWSLRSRS